MRHQPNRNIKEQKRAMTVVTRFPPSPTGFMHIGNARTALFNYLYARANDGKFLVRIEDTDRKRHNEEAVDVIFRALEWMELDYDGEAKSQFKNQKRHVEIAEQLLEKGQAYKCYCTTEELEEMREKAKAAGHATFYDRRWRDADPAEAPTDRPYVIRIKAPLEGSTVVHDLVQGDVTVANDHLDDFILLRSDGTPTYMLCVVVDDHDMGVTHVIRGDDHLNNTFRQQIIYDAMGWDLPAFAHVPLIHGSDGAKFSKRHGAQSVAEYREMGILPEAFCNYLLRLGWGHGNEEFIPRDKALELFDIGGINKAAAKFDMAKLESLNAEYLTQADPKRVLELARPFFKSRHGIELSDEAEQHILAGMEELQSRAKTLLQLTDEAAFYAKSLPFDYDEKAQNLINEGQDILAALNSKLAALEDFTSDAIQQSCKTVADEMKEGKLGKVAMPLRAAITGTTVSPSIFHACEILGKEETLARLQAAIV